MKRILIIEDDPAISMGLEAALHDEHFEVKTALDGARGFELGSTEPFDLIVLDLMLPSKSGEDICRELRAAGKTVPILMLTSKKEEIEKIVGLEIGADDYMTKPFSVRELLARVRAILRRSGIPHTVVDETRFGDVEVSFTKQEASKGGAALDLSVREYRILKFFAEHEGEVVTRDMLLDEVWGYETFPTTRTVDNYILSLRKKIESNPAEPKHLVTIHTAGYKFIR